MPIPRCITILIKYYPRCMRISQIWDIPLGLGQARHEFRRHGTPQTGGGFCPPCLVARPAQQGCREAQRCKHEADVLSMYMICPDACTLQSMCSSRLTRSSIRAKVYLLASVQLCVTIAAEPADNTGWHGQWKAPNPGFARTRPWQAMAQPCGPDAPAMVCISAYLLSQRDMPTTANKFSQWIGAWHNLS